MLGIHEDGGIGVYWGGEKADRKFLEVTDSCFWLSDRFLYQQITAPGHIFTSPGLKMTSQIKVIPDYLKTQEICNEAMYIEWSSLAFVPGHFKTQKMCNEALRKNSSILLFVSEYFNTREMCDGIMCTMLWTFRTVLKHKERVLRGLRQIHRNWVMFLIILEPGRCVIKQWGDSPFLYSMFPIGLWQRGR